MSEPGFPDEPKPKWADLFGIDPNYGDTTEAAEHAAEIATATKLGFELGKAEGRKQAGEEIAAALERCENDARRAEVAEGIAGNKGPSRTWYDLAAGYMRAAEIARDITSQPQEGVSEAIAAPTPSPRTHEAEQPGSIRIPGDEG